MGSLYWKRGRKAVELGLGTNSIAQFAGAFAVVFGYSSVMEDGRVFCIVLALFYVLVQYPERLFHPGEQARRIGAPLTRAEIQTRSVPATAAPGAVAAPEETMP